MQMLFLSQLIEISQSVIKVLLMILFNKILMKEKNLAMVQFCLLKILIEIWEKIYWFRF